MSKFHRQNTGQSVRGKPISHPIPFPDDDEFPIRTPGTGIALPLGADAESQIRMRESVAEQLEHTSHQTGIAVSDFIDPLAASHSTLPPPLKGPPEAPSRRTTVPSQMRNSVASRTTGSSGGRPQRKKSTMRAMFGKLFGRRRKGSGSSSPKDRGQSEIRAGQHRSDPTAMNRSPPTSSHKRSASLPIDEFNRALRSHSVVPDDFPLGSTENEKNRESIQTHEFTRPRGATTPSRLWTPSSIPRYADWTGLSPRPASAGRGSRVSDVVADSNIGTAITSGGHPNRRSRSLGQIRDVVAQSEQRRRSDEIRYWRDSYPGVLSPISNKAEAEEPLLVDEEVPHVGELQETPQPFSFAGMKITHAASLETRVQRLEERLMHMERMMGSRNYSRQSEDAVQIQDSPRRGASKRSTSITRPRTDDSEISLPHHKYRDPPPRSPQNQPQDTHLPPKGSRIRSSSYGSSRPSTNSTHNSYHPSFDTYPAPKMPIQPTQNTNFARPLSTSTTIRGNPSSSPTFTKEHNLNGEHYNALTNMIITEQTARQHLEVVVLALQRQLHTYLASHPTPSSGAVGDPLVSSFEQDDDSDEDNRAAYDNDLDNEEVFQTPNEVSGQFGDEIFGEAGVNQNHERKAPRTLSLSQITMGRGMQQSVNF